MALTWGVPAARGGQQQRPLSVNEIPIESLGGFRKPAARQIVDVPVDGLVDDQMDMALGTRAPPQFITRVLDTFRSERNISYLDGELKKLLGASAASIRDTGDSVRDWGSNYGVGIEMLESDPSSRRGAKNNATELWAEVRRMNLAFLRHQVQILRRVIPRGAPRDGRNEMLSEGSFADQMFMADSLRPPGLEFLNGPGPAWQIEELQYSRVPAEVVDGRKDTWTSGASGASGASGKRQPPPDSTDRMFTSYAPEDAPWSRGNPNRTPEQALAEYMGDSYVSTETMLGAAQAKGALNLDLTGRGDNWQQNGGTRFMRYPEIPFWQKLSREGADRDIRETLGTQMKESGNQVRRWDMDKLRKNNGEQYREQTPGYTQTYLA